MRKSLREMRIKLSPMNVKTFTHDATGSSAKVVGAASYGGSSYVTAVHTPEHMRGRGGAHEVMKMVTKHLDDHGHVGRLKAQGTEDGMSRSRLIKFYSKHGFKRVPGDREGNMHRDPKE